jgi:hypothetical protein
MLDWAGGRSSADRSYFWPARSVRPVGSGTVSINTTTWNITVWGGELHTTRWNQRDAGNSDKIGRRRRINVRKPWTILLREQDYHYSNRAFEKRQAPGLHQSQSSSRSINGQKCFCLDAASNSLDVLESHVWQQS